MYSDLNTKLIECVFKIFSDIFKEITISCVLNIHFYNLRKFLCLGKAIQINWSIKSIFIINHTIYDVP